VFEVLGVASRHDHALPGGDPMRSNLLRGGAFFLCLPAFVLLSRAQDTPPPEDVLAEDLQLLQGKWELLHGNEGKGDPTIQSVKEIKGNQETLRRYDVKSGKLIREHTVDFTLTSSGDVRVFTFYPVGGDAKQGQSFVYKVDSEYFYDVPGLLHGETYRNYQEVPTVWRWKKVAEPN
jgi:hypothetical protein